MHIIRLLANSTKTYIGFIIIIMSLNSAFASNIKNDNYTILALGMEMSNMRNMLKSYILIGADVKYKNPRQNLKDSMIHYEGLLNLLRTNYKDNEIQRSIENSLTAWIHIKKAMQISLREHSLQEMKDGAIFIHDNIRTVIKELAFMKKYFLSKSTMSNKKDLDASIEIAASARRLSAHYMMDLWHLDDPTIEEHWQKGLMIYANSLKILKHSSYMKNKRFASLLKSCQKYHKYFTRMEKKPKRFHILIDKKANIVFNQAKEMTEIILKDIH